MKNAIISYAMNQKKPHAKVKRIYPVRGLLGVFEIG